MPIYQEEDSFFSSEGQLYDLNQLFKIAHTLPVVEVAIADIAWGFRSELDEEDEYRIQQADARIPILVTYNDAWGWLVIDGEHRSQQASRLGRQSLPGKVLTAEHMESALCKIPIHSH